MSKIFFGAAFFQGLALVTLASTSNIFKSPHHNAVTDAQYGSIFLAQITAAILSTLWIPKLTARYGASRLFNLGLIFNILYLACLAATKWTLGQAFASFLLLALASAFLGAGFGFTISIAQLGLNKLYPNHKDAALAGVHGLLGTGAALAPIVVSFFHAQHDWAWSLAITSVGLFGILLMALKTQVVTKIIPLEASKTQDTKQKRAPLPKAAFAFLCLITLYGTVEAIIGNWTTVYLYTEKSLSFAQAGIALSLFWAFLTLGRLITAGLTQKMDVIPIYRLSPILMLLALILIAKGSTINSIYWGYVLVGLGSAAFFPLSISLAIRFHPNWEELLSSLSLTFIMIGIGLGSSFVGLLRELKWIALHHAFWLSTAIAAVLIIVAFVMTRNQSHSSVPPT